MRWSHEKRGTAVSLDGIDYARSDGYQKVTKRRAGGTNRCTTKTRG